jgi:hypothetical protein
MHKNFPASISLLGTIVIAFIFLVAGQTSILAYRLQPARPPQTSPNILEMDAGQCQSNNGKWVPSTQGIPGDGNPHNFSVNAPNGAAQFLGGAARGFVQGHGNGFEFTCTINPVQPPTVQNSESRRCQPSPGNDMSVEKCIATSGSSGSLLCEYVNATNAPSKMIELGGCWK